MNILFVNTTGGFFGGVEQNIALAAQGLTERGHSCYFVCRTRSMIDQEKFDALFAQTWELSSISFEQILSEVDIDVFYVHKYEPIDELIAVKGTKKIVRMVHDHDLYCPRRHKYYAFSRKICTRRCSLFCYVDLAFLERRDGALRYVSIGKKIREMKKNYEVDTLLVGSSYMKRELERNGFDSGRIQLLPPCVQDDPRPLQTFPQSPSILYVGQMIKGKGVDILLEAYRLLCERLEDTVTLHLIGRGNEENSLRRSAETSGILSSVTFHGWVAHDLLASYYDAATVVVVPSRWPEPFGMVGVEAMLRERAVIASEVGGIPDWLKDGQNGILVPPNDVEALYRALAALVSDTERSETMGKEGRILAQNLFPYERYIDTLEQELEK
ncbi:MAG: glycosyltransferase family 4 protein [Sphaerochaetaceae bacterium]|nr:glycosyltransferase family 4 protein [Sphaerochaetaceae bacterium]